MALNKGKGKGIGKLIIGNREHEKIFEELVIQYGEGRWSEIARGLTIHGIHVPKAVQLYNVWKTLNPSNRKLSNHQLKELVRLAIEARGNCKVYVAQWIVKFGKGCKQEHQLPNYCQNYIKRLVIKLIGKLCRKKVETKKLYKKIKIQTLTNLFKLGDYSTKDQLLNEIIESGLILGQLVITCLDYEYECRAMQYEKYSQLVNRSRFEKIIEHIVYIDELLKIHNRTYNNDADLKQSSSQYILNTIEDNKATELFQHLFQEIKYVQLYNDAKDNICSEFIFNAQEVKPQLKPITVQEVPKAKKKTIRGRINRWDKQIFHSQQCDKFKQDLLNNIDEDQEVDPDFKQQINYSEINQTRHLNELKPTDEEVDQAFQRNPQLQQQLDDEIKKVRRMMYNKLIGQEQ